MTVTEHIADTLVRGSGDGPPAGRPPLFSRLARFSVRRRRWVIAVWLVVVLAAAPLALTLTSGLSGAGWEAQGSVANQVRDEPRADLLELGAESATSCTARARQPIVSDPSGLIAVVDQLRGAPGAASVQDPLQLPPEAGMISPDGTTAMVPVHLTGDEDADLPESAARVIDHVAGIEVPDGARIEVTGEWPVWSDFNASNEEALHKAELLSGLPTIILLLVAFGPRSPPGSCSSLPWPVSRWASRRCACSAWSAPLSVWSMNSR